MKEVDETNPLINENIISRNIKKEILSFVFILVIVSFLLI
jgi:hypothetical protein